MAKLSVEEPDALMGARPDLWEPWAGNCPGPPGPQEDNALRFDADFDLTDVCSLNDECLTWSDARSKTQSYYGSAWKTYE